ncbi:uncharacterized protein [Lolium perenne]|uniref:uncharacterized protein n=1 Tax=Lolium perenne TaxID=4522 RepID=UPI003A98DC42
MGTISRYFQQVLYALVELRGDMIKPASSNTPPMIKNSYRWFPYFGDCIGDIDGTHVTAHDASILGDSLSRLDGKTRYHLNEFSPRHQPQNAKELFNLRHSSLRVTIERAFAALKNRFKVLEHKPFHTFDNQVKLVLAWCILHNWILDWGEDEFFEEVVTFAEVETDHDVDVGDNEAWKENMQESTGAMWEARGNTTICEEEVKRCRRL